MTAGMTALAIPPLPCRGVRLFSGGVAIHGAHWHNAYGEKRSHGCLNVTA
jgi:lipoprotein-anchoring transpeptidase ErfK/SrfK